MAQRALKELHKLTRMRQHFAVTETDVLIFHFLIQPLDPLHAGYCLSPYLVWSNQAWRHQLWTMLDVVYAIPRGAVLALALVLLLLLLLWIGHEPTAVDMLGHLGD